MDEDKHEKTRASVAFVRATEGLKQSEVADRIGVTQGFVSRLMAAKSKPENRVVALRIQSAFGIDPAWWDEPVEPPKSTRTSATTEPKTEAG